MKHHILALTLVIIFAACVATAQPLVAPNEVKLCEHHNWMGYCYSVFLESGMRQRLVPKLPPAIDNKASSILVGDQVWAWIFLDADFVDAASFKTENSADLPTGIEVASVPTRKEDDEISSLVVCRREAYTVPHGLNAPPAGMAGVFLETIHGYGTTRSHLFPLPQDPSRTEVRYSNLSGHVKGWAAAVSLQGHVEVELYEHADFKGKRLDLPGWMTGTNRFDLIQYQMAASVSSLIVRQRGSDQVAHLNEPPAARGSDAEMTRHRTPIAVPTPALAIIPGEIVQPGSPSLALQYDSDRPGHDYKNFDLPQARPELCRDQCAQDPRCKAFTYVSPGLQGPSARCWLKDMVSRPQRVKGLVSGVKHNLPQP